MACKDREALIETKEGLPASNLANLELEKKETIEKIIKNSLKNLKK